MKKNREACGVLAGALPDLLGFGFVVRYSFESCVSKSCITRVVFNNPLLKKSMHFRHASIFVSLFTTLTMVVRADLAFSTSFTGDEGFIRYKRSH